MTREFHLPTQTSGTLDMSWQSGWVNMYVNDSTTMAQLASYTQFTNLFDQYRIDKVDYTFIPGQNVSDATNNTYENSGTGCLPTLLIAADLDGASTAITTESQLLQYGHHVKHRLDTPFTFSVVPRVSTALYVPTSVGFGIPDGPQWVDSSSSLVPHYGVVWAADPGGVGSGYTAGQSVDIHWCCKVYKKVHLSLRNVI
jgi:hypothetical protein